MNYISLLKKILICSIGFWFAVEFSSFVFESTAKINYYIQKHRIYHPLSPKVKLVKTNLPYVNTGEPTAKRDKQYRLYLQSSVMIKFNDSLASGTICYYDDKTNESYVLSCGHIFKGNMDPQSLETNLLLKTQIIVFYKNNKKLIKPKIYQADVICYNNDYEISLMKFSPDWVIKNYFPIAPSTFKVKQGDVFESTGCDYSSEPASYTVKIVKGMNLGENFITMLNSPRPGRSGGGLLTKGNYCIGIAWGTSEFDGTGYGFFVPLRRIHEYFNKFEEVKWILDVGMYDRVINMIPIYNSATGQFHNNPSNGYIPLPK